MLGSVNVKSKKAIILAFQKGYRVNENGDVISPKGRILKKQVSNRNDIPYFSFSIRLDKYDVCKIMIHRFVAYLKYGDLMFNCECIRHLNGNSLDNSFENIEVGSHRDNILDIPKDIRKRSATIASHSYMMKWDSVDVKDIKAFYDETKSYKKTMERFGISSKSTLYNILKNR